MKEEERPAYKLLKEAPLLNEKLPDKKKLELWQSIQNCIQLRKKKRVMRLRWCYSMAASVTLFFFISLNTNMWTQQIINTNQPLMAATLPDGSTMSLQAHSDIRYNKLFWWAKRRVELNGNAFFHVAQGKRFAVLTPHGVISVLGTKFRITQNESNMNVQCYEGSVQVKTPYGEKTLKMNEQVDCSKGKLIQSLIEPEEKPAPDYEEYTAAPVPLILKKIESTYHVKVINAGLCEEYTFTGLISLRNLDEALEVLFGSCGFDYTCKNQQITLSKRE